jgi:ATP-binding cassette, subfamily B, bacterial
VRYFLRVVPYLRPYWHLAVSSGFVSILVTLLGLLSPWPLQILIDSVLGDHPLPAILARLLGPLASDRFGLLVFAVTAGLTITLVENALNVLNSHVQTKAEQRMILDFRSDLFQHAQRLPLAFHDNRRSGMLMYAINFQADAAASLTMTLQPLAQSFLTLAGMLWIVLRIDPTLALLSLVVVPFLYYSVRYYSTKIEPRLEEVKGMEGETLSIIHEAMSMLRVIVAFGREDHEHRRFREQGRRAVDARVGVTVRQTLFSLAVNSTTAAGTALVLGFGAYQALQGRLTVGQLLVVMSYIAAVYQPLESISYTIGSLQNQFVSLRMAFNLYDTKPDITDRPGAVTTDKVQGHIRFENVHFSYTGRTDTLKNVSFEVQAGQVVGMVGPTGAGKSTLVSLIPRFYESTEGRILLDGRDIREYTLHSLREQISVVHQEPMLFSGTIEENIRYGRLDATMDEIMDAARAANAHDFIMRLPQKYATRVGERGVQLSGGERQRISIARAFLKDAPVLILDEPTSAIDSKTEAVILEALERLMIGRTTFMIAHRLSTLRNADLILVVNHGEIVEQGTHYELMELDGLYKQLCEMQAATARRQAQAPKKDKDKEDPTVDALVAEIESEPPSPDEVEGEIPPADGTAGADEEKTVETLLVLSVMPATDDLDGFTEANGTNGHHVEPDKQAIRFEGSVLFKKLYSTENGHARRRATDGTGIVTVTEDNQVAPPDEQVTEQ